MLVVVMLRQLGVGVVGVVGVVVVGVPFGHVGAAAVPRSLSLSASYDIPPSEKKKKKRAGVFEVNCVLVSLLVALARSLARRKLHLYLRIHFVSCCSPTTTSPSPALANRFVCARQLKSVRKQFNEYDTMKRTLLYMTVTLMSYALVVVILLADDLVLQRRVAIFCECFVCRCLPACLTG